MSQTVPGRVALRTKRFAAEGVPPPVFTFQDDPEFGTASLVAGYAGANLSLLGGRLQNRLAFIGSESNRKDFGEFDFVKNVFEEIGGTIKFWKVDIRPGRPFVFGQLKNIESEWSLVGYVDQNETFKSRWLAPS